MKQNIRETIVVEGYHDARAVKAAVDAEVIITSGFAIKEETFRRIAWAQEKVGVIVLTDPDHVGEQIRKRISQRIPGVRHAWISRSDGTKGDDIGVENAEPRVIEKALSKAHCVMRVSAEGYTAKDMIAWGLSGCADAARRRDVLGSVIGVGYGNAKQLLHRFNTYGITRDSIEAALEAMET